jgi:hypothetical protein
MQGSDCYNNAPAAGNRTPLGLAGPSVVSPAMRATAPAFAPSAGAAGGEDLGKAETPQQQSVAEDFGRAETPQQQRQVAADVAGRAGAGTSSAKVAVPDSDGQEEAGLSAAVAEWCWPPAFWNWVPSAENPAALAGGCAAAAADEAGRVEPELWHFASANVLTLRQRDEAQHGVPSARRLELADMFQSTGLDIVGIQEGRCTPAGYRFEGNYHMFATEPQVHLETNSASCGCELCLFEHHTRERAHHVRRAPPLACEGLFCRGSHAASRGAGSPVFASGGRRGCLVGRPWSGC